MSGFGFNYNSLQTNAKQPRLNAVPPPPPTSTVSKQGYSTMKAISQNALSAAWGGSSRKRAATEDEYFEDDEEEVVPELAYIPAPGSPTYVQQQQQKQEEQQADDGDDPLDAYMAGIEKQVGNVRKSRELR